MTQSIDSLTRAFREGRREESIAACEAWHLREPANLPVARLCANMHLMTRDFARALDVFRRVRELDPKNPDVLFNIGLCERELGDVAAAVSTFERYTKQHPVHPDGWIALGESKLRRQDFSGGMACAIRALELDPAAVPAWTVRGQCEKALGLADKAVLSFGHAIQLAPGIPGLRVHRGDVFEAAGDLARAAEDFRAALALAPGDEATLRKATLCLLHLDKGNEAVALCRQVLARDPGNLAARLGAEWLLTQMVPLWHVPMMNEEERNRPYFEGLRAVVTPQTTVFEVGTGSGLLAMMAARLGARQVVTCESVGLVAEVATRIVARNNLQDRVKVLAKPSYAVQMGTDLPVQADILVHEIFSSELLGEHVLPALEDAKARLLKPGGTVLPGVASLMIGLVGGDALGKELHVDSAFGFDLSPFNAIHPRKRPIYREDLPRILLSDPVEAFRFDFNAASTFPAEAKRLDVRATQQGLCWGVIQWIRFEFPGGAVFENHPSVARPVASWQHTIYRFDEPLLVQAGQAVAIDAMHDRSRPWFERAASR